MRRVEVQEMLDRGMSDEAINSFEIGKYGEETLRVPLDTGYRRMVWILPVAALLGAAGVLVMVARRSSAKLRGGAGGPAAAKKEPTVGPDDEYQSRLDDELDELD
jgi:cytochrome c-type biogenesis protein CcmH/NrfF